MGECTRQESSQPRFATPSIYIYRPHTTEVYPELPEHLFTYTGTKEACDDIVYLTSSVPRFQDEITYIKKYNALIKTTNGTTFYI